MARPFIPHGMPRFAQSRDAQSEPRPTWSERLQALRYVTPLLRMVYQTHAGYTVSIVLLRLLRGVVPLVVLWIGKLIIAVVIGAVQSAGAVRPVAWEALALLVSLEFLIAFLWWVLARAALLPDPVLGALV